MLSEFDDYARELRRAKDQDEFDRFMANRNAVNGSGEDSDDSDKAESARRLSSSGGLPPQSKA